MNFKKSAAVILAVFMTAILFAGCGKVNASETALVINGETINAGTASTYVRYQQAATYTMMYYYGMIDETTSYWDMAAPADETVASSDGAQTEKTYGEAFLDDCRNSLLTMTLIRQHADEFGFSLSDEQKQAITDAAAQFISDNGSVANWIGADQASVENMLSLIAHQVLMYDLIIEDTDREIPEEDAAQSTIIYARLPVETPGNYVGTDEKYTAEIREDLEELITEMTSGGDSLTAENLTAENTEEEAAEDETAETEDVTEKDIVSEMAAAINESFFVTSASFGNDDTVLDDAVKEAARTLKDGETYASIIETDQYLYAVKMVEVFDQAATDNHKLNIIAQRENENFNNKIEGWKEAAEVTEGKGWTSLKVNSKENYIAGE